jgi:hypothetical protein
MNDASFFPRALRQEIEFDDAGRYRVRTSVCTIVLTRDDGAKLRLSRDVLGTAEHVRVEEFLPEEGEPRRSMLNARLETMQDEHGGLQRFLFEWLRWPRKQVTTYNRTAADVYLENLLPLFYIEQGHGWGNLQATQVTRYRQQQIDEVAVEYLLGATAAVDARFVRNQAQLKDAALRETAKELAARASSIFLRHGWSVEWLGEGTLAKIQERWSAYTLRDALLSAADVDLVKNRVTLVARLVALRRKLTGDPLDPDLISAPTGASQRVINLKQRRHELNDEFRTMRVQLADARELFDSLSHRLQAALDVYRYKTTGIGRLSVMECPTCHRDIDLNAFQLEQQSSESVLAHIEALKRDRDLIRKNVESLEDALEKMRAEAARVDGEFQDAERTLQMVNQSIGTTREQLAETAGQVTATEKVIDRLDEAASALDELQDATNRWLEEARAVQQLVAPVSDLAVRVRAFTESLRLYLVALGHSAVTPSTSHAVRLDDRYEPHLAEVELKAMGSASDGPRLVAAYSLALATASAQVAGLQPGMLLLDEPLQQNPDDPHRKLFLAFLLEEHRRQLSQTTKPIQTLIFTSLYPDEVERLRAADFPLQTPEGVHFLQLIVPPVSPEGEGKRMAEAPSAGSVPHRDAKPPDTPDT